ncbi:MAG: M4 family metallopeptidase, partial [Myxococcota bacterium]|nr:M4 family metallopeptidase [Myxococcota bacterium]
RCRAVRRVRQEQTGDARDPTVGTASVSGARAREIAAARVGRSDADVREPVLGVYDPEPFEATAAPPRPAYQVDVRTGEPAIWRHYVDAQTGAVLFVFDVMPRDQKRDVFWGNNTWDLPGTLIYRYDPYYWYESWPGTSEVIAQGNQAAWNYMWNRFERDSWDHNQAPAEYHRLRTTSDHRAAGTKGAWWDRDLRQCKFGDLCTSNDVVGHEVFHGVDSVEAKLGDNRVGQTGALSESFPDIFGEFVERYASGSGPDWLMATVGTCRIRDIANPESHSCEGCDVQPAHFSNYGRWGGSFYDDMGIPSKSGWLLGREAGLGSDTFAGISVTGIGEVDAGRVWYDVLTNRLNSNSNFTIFRNAVIGAAASLFGVGNNRYVQALNSVDAIGLHSYDYWYNFDSHHRVALAIFTVSGQERRYIFYREPVDADPRLFFRFRTCPIYVGCDWSAATFLDYTGRGPGAVVFDGKLWVFYKYDLDNYIWYRTLDSAGSWSGWQRPTGTPTTDSDLAATAFDGKLYLFYKTVGAGATAIAYRTWTPGGVGWQGPFSAGGASTEGGPAAVAPLINRLRLVYLRGTTSPNLRQRSMTTAGAWTAESTPSDNLNTAWVGSPTAHLFRSRLHVAGRSSPANEIIYRSLCDDAAGCTYRPGNGRST